MEPLSDTNVQIYEPKIIQPLSKVDQNVMERKPLITQSSNMTLKSVEIESPKKGKLNTIYKPYTTNFNYTSNTRNQNATTGGKFKNYSPLNRQKTTTKSNGSYKSAYGQSYVTYQVPEKTSSVSATFQSATSKDADTKTEVSESSK